MPATHLISVDLPAPLSPTSAITSPSRTSKSTACSAWTDPKLLETARSSRVGAGVSFTGGFFHGGGARREGLPPEGLFLSVLLLLNDPDLAPLQGPLREPL